MPAGPYYATLEERCNCRAPAWVLHSDSIAVNGAWYTDRVRAMQYRQGASF